MIILSRQPYRTILPSARHSSSMRTLAPDKEVHYIYRNEHNGYLVHEHMNAHIEWGVGWGGFGGGPIQLSAVTHNHLFSHRVARLSQWHYLY